MLTNVPWFEFVGGGASFPSRMGSGGISGARGHGHPYFRVLRNSTNKRCKTPDSNSGCFVAEPDGQWGYNLGLGACPSLFSVAAELDKFCFAKFWTRTVLAKASENKEGHKRALMGSSDTPAAHPALHRAILNQAHSKQSNGGCAFGA